MKVLLWLAAPLWIAATVWGAAALWIDFAGPRPLAGALALGFVFAMGGILLRVRPVGRALLISALVFAGVLAWWLAIPPSNDRDWLPDVARLPRAHFDGDLVTISNVRDFHYRSETDYDERWEERTYDLSQIRGADLFLIYWGSPWIAHTIASWDFADGSHLAISIETRKEKGEEYSAVLGFFRQFELYYVVADERDVVGLRAAHRGEEVYLYHLQMPPETARAVLVDYLEEVNRLADHPTWYNALTHNCTTTIRHHAQHVGGGRPFDWRILVNGRIDQLGYERGQIDTSLPFEELRRRSDVTEKAKAAIDDPDFSARIREGLPGVRP
jgi:Domain of unknown function (DUF4105)